MDDNQKVLPLMEEFTDEGGGTSLLDHLEEDDKTPEELEAEKADVEKQEADRAKAEKDAEKVEKEAAKAAEKLEKEEAEKLESERIDALDDDDPEKIKAIKGVDKDKDKEKDKDEEDDEEDGTFWSDVEKLTGRQVEVDYSDLDPESPEGAALREDAVAQSAINDQLDYLSRMFPKEFRALEHAANGGSIDDLYKQGEPDYSKIVIPEDDEEFQKNFMRNYYVKKGFKEARASRMVETDQDSEDGLFKSSQEALKELSANQETEQQGIIQQQQQVSKQAKQADLQIIGSVEQIVQEGKLNKFTVPIKEREEFYQFALSHMQRSPQGGYMFVMPVQNQQLEQQLQDMYFTYKRGDLSSIIQREAKSDNARKLKRNIGKGAKKSAGGSQEENLKRRAGLPTMDEHTV